MRNKGTATLNFLGFFLKGNQFQHMNKSLTRKGQTQAVPRMEIMPSHMLHTERQ